MLLMMQPVNALTLKGGVEYTVESAREEAFRNIEYQISMEPHKKYLKDPGFTPGEGGKKPKISKKGRYVNHFSDGSYGVRYYTNWEYLYIYSNNGELEGIEVRRETGKFPFLSKVYKLNGQLFSVALWVSKNELFSYDLNGELISHWIKDNGYDKTGKLVIKRSYYKF